MAWISPLAVLMLGLTVAAAQDTNTEETPPAFPARILETNQLELLRTCLQMQEQLRTLQLAVQQNREESKAAAARTDETLSNAFHTVEETFAAQRTRDLEAMRASNRATLVVAATFAGVGFLTMLLVGYFQWRMSKGLAELSTALPAALGLGAGSALPGLNGVGQPGSRMLVTAGHPETPPRAPGPGPQPTLKPRGAPGAPEIRFIPSLAPSMRKRPVRALRTAIIVGLICAAILALLFYLIAFQRPGLGHVYGVFKH